MREGSPPKFPFSIKCPWNSQAYGGQPSGTDRSVVGLLTCISYLSSEVIFSIITGKGSIVSTLIMQRLWSWWWSCSKEKKNFLKYKLTIDTRGARHQTKRSVWQRLIDLQELFMHLLLYSTGSRALNRQCEKVGRRCKLPSPYRTNRSTGDPPPDSSSNLMSHSTTSPISFQY